jgi:hypothetical protein
MEMEPTMVDVVLQMVAKNWTIARLMYLSKKLIISASLPL